MVGWCPWARRSVVSSLPEYRRRTRSLVAFAEEGEARTKTDPLPPPPSVAPCATVLQRTTFNRGFATVARNCGPPACVSEAHHQPIQPVTPYFHLAFPVDDLAAARVFYGDILGCNEGRSDPAWVDFDLFGHQIVAHLQPAAVGDRASSAVDGHGVPIPHFGLIMEMPDWERLAQRLKSAGVKFVIEP